MRNYDALLTMFFDHQGDSMIRIFCSFRFFLLTFCCNIFLIALSDFKVARHGYICESRWNTAPFDL